MAEKFGAPSNVSFSYFQLGSKDQVLQKLYEKDINGFRMVFILLNVFIVTVMGLALLLTLLEICITGFIDWSDPLAYVHITVNLASSIFGIYVSVVGFILTTNINEARLKIIINPKENEVRTHFYANLLHYFAVVFLLFVLANEIYNFKAISAQWRDEYGIGLVGTISCIVLSLVVITFAFSWFLLKARSLSKAVKQYYSVSRPGENLYIPPPESRSERPSIKHRFN